MPLRRVLLRGVAVSSTGVKVSHKVFHRPDDYLQNLFSIKYLPGFSEKRLSFGRQVERFGA